MLIALLVVLGVNLIVVATFAVLVLGRRRWLKRQPGEFAGAIRVAGGAVEGLTAKWKRGSGHWLRDVLVWTKPPLMLRYELVPIDRLASERDAREGEVKRLGDKPVVIEFASDDAIVELAASSEHRAFVIGGRTARPTPEPSATAAV